MCGKKLSCTLLLGALATIVSAGKTPGMGIAAPYPAEFAIAYTGVVSAGHTLKRGQ